MKRKIALCLLCLLALLPGRARAAEAIDPRHLATLTIHCERNGAAVAGMHFALYRVASVSPYGEYALTGDFAEDNVLLDDSDWDTVAWTLASIARRDGRSPLDQGETDKSGVLRFPTEEGEGLEPGLYLLLASPCEHGSYTDTAAPYLVALPGLNREENCWEYTVTSYPKLKRSYREETETTLERRVLKVWADNESSNRPQSITVQLLKNGEVYDTQTLTADTGWAHTWVGLPARESGRLIDWQVAETSVEGYTVTIRQEGSTFLVTNTATTPENPGTPTDSEGSGDSDSSGTATLPQTGALWWPVPVLAGAGLGFVAMGILLKKRDDA